MAIATRWTPPTETVDSGLGIRTDDDVDCMARAVASHGGRASSSRSRRQPCSREVPSDRCLPQWTTQRADGHGDAVQPSNGSADFLTRRCPILSTALAVWFRSPPARTRARTGSGSMRMASSPKRVSTFLHVSTRRRSIWRPGQKLSDGPPAPETTSSPPGPLPLRADADTAIPDTGTSSRWCRARRVRCPGRSHTRRGYPALRSS